MEVFHQIDKLREYLLKHNRNQRLTGFVPTMGALHEGHIHLVKSSLTVCDLTICSIYVNPSQFNNPEDLRRYPRPLKKDLQILEAGGCQVAFCPSDAEMYPGAFNFSLHPGYHENIMEGAFRPGHFRGVSLVVAKLFNIVRPDVAFFGRKDLQQCIIIKQMVRELNFPVDVRCVETVREPDGLAMSSRNRLLSTGERRAAPLFYQSLLKARENLLNGQCVDEVKQSVAADLDRAGEPLRLEYFEIADAENLKPLDVFNDRQETALCIAGYAGTVRLIDNLIVKSANFESE